MTFSIVAFDPDSGSWGIAVASKFLAVGAVVPWGRLAPALSPPRPRRTCRTDQAASTSSPTASRLSKWWRI